MKRIMGLAILVPLMASAQFALPRNFTSQGGPIPIPLPNSVGCYGDSIMAGACQGINVCVRVSAQITGSISANDAVSGYTASQISTCYFTGVGGVCDPYTTQCIGDACGTLLIQGGVNSLKAPGAITGIVEAQTVAEMKPIVVNALGRARRVVWIGVLPYASCDVLTCPILMDPDTRAREYNRLMLIECANLQAAYGALLSCVSPYDQFQATPPPPGILGTPYACADGIHLTDVGVDKIGPQTLACDVLTALGVACP